MNTHINQRGKQRILSKQLENLKGSGKVQLYRGCSLQIGGELNGQSMRVSTHTIEQPQGKEGQPPLLNSMTIAALSTG
eukprot:10504566-Heterocapsa_arctica.AAC.1